jgi:penicillin-binding protein 1A
MADDVYARIQSINNNDSDSTNYYSYFVDEVIDQAIQDLQSKLGYTQAQATNLIYSGGLSIYTTQDPTIQKVCDKVYSDKSYFPKMGISYYQLTYALSVQKADGKTIHYHGNDLMDYYKNYNDPHDLYLDENGNKFSLLFLDKKDMQKKIDKFKKAIVKDGDTIIGENATMTIQPQSSFVVMDQHTGQVQAIIGGRGEKTGNRTLDRATDTKRQPGSTFKILSTYLPAIDSGEFTLASVQDDAGPYYYPGTKEQVTNWTAVQNYNGLTPLRQAIYNSMNIVTVKTMAQVTPQVGYEYLLKLGFTTLVDSRKEANGKVVSDINLPLALGGLTDGVSNLELTAAYAAIANEGIYTKPTFYTKILDHNGKVLLKNTPKKEQVMKESTAFLLTSAMEDVVNKGTGTNLKLTAINMPVAGKTGSTSNYNDLWFSGYTPYYTATVWSGFDENRSQIDKTYCRRIWKTIMEQIHIKKKLETKSFIKPDSIVTARFCTKSGKLAVEGLCDKYKGGDTTKIEYFAKGTEPTEKCDVHIKATICTKSGKLATDFCPKNDIKEEVFLDKKETCKTADSPFILPSKSCNIHNKFNQSDPVDENSEAIDNPDYTNDPDSTNSNNTDTNNPDNDYTDQNLEDSMQNIFNPSE